MQATQRDQAMSALTAALNRFNVMGTTPLVNEARNNSFSRSHSRPPAPNSAQAPSTACNPPPAGNTEERTRVQIPQEPVSKSLKSIAGVWDEYMCKTGDKPSIRRLIDDHGLDWHSSTYQYCRGVWNKKKRIILAIEALKRIKQLSGNAAVAYLENWRLKESKQAVNNFAESLPTVHDSVDVSGKCKSDSGSWRALGHGDPLYDEYYSEYLRQLRTRLQLDTNLL